MSDIDPLEPIPVLRSHLEGTLGVLRGAYGYCVTADLQSQYLAGRANPKYSALTKQLEGLISRYEDYLRVEEDGDEFS